MALQTMEAPAGAGMYVLCPNCSRMHAAEEYAPTCKRCGTAMKEQEEGTSESSRIPRK